MYTMHMQVPIGVRSRHRIPGTGAKKNGLSYSVGPLQEQRVP